MSNFLFDGRSRQTKMSFASDHRPTRDHLLLEAQQRRQKREEDLRRNAAALKVQRAVRQWLACRRVACLAYTAILRLDNNNNNNGNAHIEPLSSSSSSSAHAIPERLAHACWCQQFLRSNAVKMSAHSWGAVVMSEGISTGGGGGSVPWTPDAVLHRCSSIIGSALRGILQPPPGGGLSIPVADIPLRVLSAAVVMLLDDFGRTVQQQQQLQSTVDTARVISSLTTMQDLVHSCVRAAPSRTASSSGDALTDAAECIAFKSLLYCAQYLSHCPDARLEIADLVCPLLEADLVQFTCSDLAASDGCVDVDNEEEREAEAKKLLSCLISRKADEASSSVLLSGSRRTTWTEVCLACLAAPSTLEYMPLTDNPLFALISIAPTREIVNSGSWCIRAVEGIVRAGYYGIVQHPELLIGRHGEWESRAMVALGRLTRLLPVFLPQAPGTTFTTTDGALLLVRKAWMQCIGTLCEGLCQTEVFVQTILYDLHHRSEGHYGAGGRYRHLVSHLFSSEGGLRLLELVAMSEDATTTPATVPSHVSDDVQLSALNTISSIEIACSMYAWPLFSFSLASSTHRLETSAVFAKLIRTPPLLRQLWRLYSNRCEGIHALLQGADGEGGVLHKLCLKACTPDVTVRLPVWQTAPPALLSSLSGTRVKHMAFWDPQPATSALFFTLFSYYLDVTDFAEDLKRDTVLTHRECWALLFALKEIVHRSHMHGVVPSSNSEAVAHLAYLLLGKLHAINESSAIVPYPSIWVSITDEATLLTLGSVTPEMWEELSLRHEAALKALVSKVEGASSSSVPGSEHGDEEASPAKAIGLKHSSQQLPGDDLLFDGSLSWSMEERIVYLLMHAPFLLPFPQRAALLSMLLLSQQPQRVPGLPQTFVAHRGRTFVDAYDRFHEQPDSTQMFAVRFASESGMVEEGYGHGVYREFMVSVCREGLAVEYGLFRQTEDGFVFPNNFSLEATGDPLHLRKINFLGTMVGRALRDGILQDVPFALHFRNALLGRRNSINNLKSFDPELYQQLLALTKLGKEDLDAIGMTFSYTVTSLGITKEVELIKGGAEVFVTPHNCLHYIHLVADYKLNREGRPQTYAFQSGLESIIQHSWLSLFDSNELLNLFGGDQSGKIDISDWKQHTVYKNPDDVQSVPVRLFWEVVESLSNEQQRKLLQFATSMNRPPLLGFRFLSPPFNVHILADNTIDRLPSASTCFSMLKLPPYKDYASARAKIIAAIEESNSFGLT